ncbi:MAG: MlaD family protein [Planctomycetota bacterium]|nr:MlaD family protein [Planctomycetota bacterium]
MSKSMEIKAGLVIVVGALIGLLGLFMVSGGPDALRDKTIYTVHFPNVGGLREGNDVLLAGVKVGSVHLVESKRVLVEGEERRMVEVQVEIFATGEVQEDSEVFISSSVTGTTRLNIEYGTGPRATSKSVLIGYPQDTFEDLMHEASLAMGEVNAAVQTAKGAVERLDRILEGFEKENLPRRTADFIDTLDRGAAEFEKTIADIRAPAQEVIVQLKETVSHADDLVERLLQDWDGIVGDVREAARELRSVTETVDAILKENRNDVRELVQSMRDAALRVAPALASIEQLMSSANETVEEVRPRLVAAMESGKEALHNFNDVTEDLKTAPWKLINKPSEAEVQRVHLYNALRLWTDGVRDIQQHIEELEALKASGALEDPKRAGAVEKTIAQLEKTVRSYDRLWADVQKELLEIRSEGAKR